MMALLWQSSKRGSYRTRYEGPKGGPGMPEMSQQLRLWVLVG